VGIEIPARVTVTTSSQPARHGLIVDGRSRPVQLRQGKDYESTSNPLVRKRGHNMPMR
jgi:hypothetical protein